MTARQRYRRLLVVGLALLIWVPLWGAFGHFHLPGTGWAIGFVVTALAGFGIESLHPDKGPWPARRTR